jgi:hypothetical protein
MSGLDAILRTGYPYPISVINIVNNNREMASSLVVTPNSSFWTDLQANKANQLKTKKLCNPFFPGSWFLHIGVVSINAQYF